jgi:broad specificity phosphatase PhoE
MRLILVRHPQPMVTPGVCYGRTDLGVAADQLEATLAALLRLAAGTALPLYSSPLRRCAGLAARLSPAPIYDERLVEMDFGTWEMQPWDAIPRAGIDAWAADMVNYQPGGGESVLQMATRISALLRRPPASARRRWFGDHYLSCRRHAPAFRRIRRPGAGSDGATRRAVRAPNPLRRHADSARLILQHCGRRR